MLPCLRHINKRRLLDFVHPVCSFDFNMIFVIKGEFLVKTDTNEFIIRANDILITPPAVAHRITGLSEDSDVYFLNFDLDTEHSYLPFLHCEAADVFDETLAIFPKDREKYSIRHIPGCDFAKDLLGKMMFERINNDIYYKDICNSVLHQLLLECERRHNREMPSVINAIIEFISNNYTKKISNKAIADNLGYHTVHMNRLFTKHMGTTVHQYVTECRLKEARRLLVSTELSIAEISDAVGFDYPEYFTKVYKDFFSVTPTQTRHIRELQI